MTFTFWRLHTFGLLRCLFLPQTFPEPCLQSSQYPLRQRQSSSRFVLSAAGLHFFKLQSITNADSAIVVPAVDLEANLLHSHQPPFV